MKRHLLALAASTAALALSTGAYAADNKAYVDQNGTGVAQKLEVNQTGSNGNAGFNGSALKQDGGGNDLLINQSGSYNSVGQIPGASGPMQSSQVGNNNSLRIDQQGGSQNGVVFSQAGDNNNRRGASAPPSDRSPTLFGAPVNYGVYPGSQWNYIRQSDGTANATRVNQNGDSNGLIILQDGGTRNAARLIQTSMSGTTDAGGVNLAYFSQQGGTDNTIRLIQTNTTQAGTASNREFNSADIRQIGGSGNVVARYDTSIPVAAGSAPLGAARQVGSGLDLFVQQSNSNNQLSVDQQATDSRIEVVQNGTGASAVQANRVNVFQTGVRQSAQFQQDGNTNTVDSNQTGTLTKVATLQSGDGNRIINNQYSSGYGAEAILSSVGSGNLIVNQQSNGAFAQISQTGNNNQSFNNQEGIVGLNKVFVTQSSSNNYASTYQQGSGDTIGSMITINQYGDGSHRAEARQASYSPQTMLIDQDGYHNTAVSFQIGSNNSGSIYQGSSNNYANMQQSGVNNTAIIRQNR